MPHVILFDGAGFVGAHLHVFKEETDLDAHMEGAKTSSIAILDGNWEIFTSTGFTGSRGVLGPGIYPGLGNLDHEHENDTVYIK
jgi:hypothetical protein